MKPKDFSQYNDNNGIRLLQEITVKSLDITMNNLDITICSALLLVVTNFQATKESVISRTYYSINNKNERIGLFFQVNIFL